MTSKKERLAQSKNEQKGESATNSSGLLPIEFQFASNLKDIRVIMNGNDPWFIAKDICDILEIVNTSQALEQLDSDEKGISISDTLGGEQKMLTVNESGLYALIFQSRKPEAKRFRKFITSVVIPSIRKTGSYGIINRKAITPAQVDDILPFVDMVMHNGHPMYAAKQLLDLLGKFNGTSAK